MPVRDIAGGGPTRINDHHPHLRIVALRLRQPLIEYRMRPGGVRPDQHHQIAVFHVLIAARHHISAQRPFVAGNR